MSQSLSFLNSVVVCISIFPHHLLLSKWMMNTAKHVVCMDANLGDHTYNTVQRMRPSPPIHLHWNKYSHAKDDKFHFTTKHVVCMDANLGDHTYNTVQRMRPSPPIHLHWNKYSHAKDDKFHFTTNMGEWMGHLLNAVGNGQKIVVPVNSINHGKVIEEMIKKLFEGKQVRLYSSETLPSIKREHFRHVDSYWSDLDVLIYTPTVSAGVSFEMEHF